MPNPSEIERTDVTAAAKRAYATFCAEMGFDGDWKGLPQRLKTLWEKVALAVLQQ